MDKVNVKVWLKDKIINATNELRAKLETPEIDPAIVAIRGYFDTGDLRRSDVRLNAIKKLFKDFGHTNIEHVTLESLNEPAIVIPRFALMKLEANPNGHNYSGNYFVAIRSSVGVRQDGTYGNNFPNHETGRYKAPNERDANTLADKYVELLSGDNDLHDYIEVMKPLVDDFIDFTL